MRNDNLPADGFISLMEARAYVPTIKNSDGMRLWLWRRRDRIHRKHGRIYLPDLLKEVTKNDR